MQTYDVKWHREAVIEWLYLKKIIDITNMAVSMY